jgi:imidazolonepropionase-like amidohydrolase
MSVIADGVDEVLKATREELRRGASHIKIVASGGVASPTDPVDAMQYSPEEIAAIVGECDRHGSYVAAHCHPNKAIRLCAELGVRSIEHGTLIDPETAEIVKASGAFIVPTMAIVAGLLREGDALGLPKVSQDKLAEIAGHARSGMAIAHAAGVPMGFGTDLLGPLYTQNLTEFELRRDVFSPLEILRQATSVNARLMRLEGEIGCVKVGALADLIAVDGDPFADIGVMTKGAATMPLVMKGGQIIRNSIV